MFKTCAIFNLSVFVQLLYMKEMLSHTRYNCSGRWRRGGSKSTFQDSVPVLRLRGCETAFIPEQVRMWRVHRSLGVGTVWRWISASGGWNCLPSLGETQCRRQAWPYSGVRQLGRVRGQAQGRHLRGPDGTGGTWSGQTPSIRHLLRISTPGRRGMLLAGGVAGAEPPHKGGPNRPDRPNCSSQ